MKYNNALINEPAINITKDHEKILKNVQANILRHHKRRWSKHIFIKFYNEIELDGKSPGEKIIYKESSIRKARAFLATLSLTSAYEQLIEEDTTTPIRCMYLSYKGYNFLNLTSLMPSSTSFKKGISDQIKEGFNVDETESVISDAHAMILIAADLASDPNPNDPDQNDPKTKNFLDSEFNNLKSKLATTNCEIIFEQDGEMVASNISSKRIYKEQFGFVDGISNARFFPKQGKNKSSIHASSIASLRTVLVSDFDETSFGSYLVFLKLEQDSKAFELLYGEMAKRIDPAREGKDLEHRNEAKALIMGRYANGAPIMKKDKKKDYIFDNDFDYQELISDGHSWKKDDGLACPYFSHVRKANARDRKDRYSNNAKIVRRGVNYRDEKVGTRIPKGLLFMSFQRDIQKQFETLITETLHNPYNADGSYTGSDILTGKTDQLRVHDGNPKKMSITPAKVEGMEDRNLVTLKGSAYFFAPSLLFFNKCLEFYPPVEFQGNIGGINLQKNTPPVQLKTIPQGIVDGIKNIDLKPIHFSDYRDEILKKILKVDVLEAEKNK